MAQVNLRTAFLGGAASTITAQRVFTNRVSETTAFSRSLEGLHEALDAAEVSPVVDRLQ
ncbi:MULTISPECIES: hypothetical protein [unclassified Streptomyces]|uniref:hypothetical protein n=1 Tax=unclassified Streptomyces TaxID=2593676 RepID=UPI0036F1166A